MRKQYLSDKARIILLCLAIVLLLFLLLNCKPQIEAPDPCRILYFHDIPYEEMVFKMQTVLPTLEPWREVWIHWIDGSGKHRVTRYYSYDELHEKALKEVKNVQTIMIFCEDTPKDEKTITQKRPVSMDSARPSFSD